MFQRRLNSSIYALQRDGGAEPVAIERDRLLVDVGQLSRIMFRIAGTRIVN